MTTPELITDEIVKSFIRYMQKLGYKITPNHARAGILTIQDDITRPVYNLLRGYKQDVEAYKRALNEIDKYHMEGEYEGLRVVINKMALIARAALKGDYHKTDFTEFCENNPTVEEV